MANYTLHHIHHETVDVDMTTAFYTDNFNAEVTERIERDGVQWQNDSDHDGPLKQPCYSSKSTRVRITAMLAK